MFPTDPKIQKLVRECDEVVDAGWDALRKTRKATGIYLNDKEIFFAGAAFLFDAVMNSVSADTEPTAADLLIMDKLHRELQCFNAEFNFKVVRGRSR